MQRSVVTVSSNEREILDLYDDLQCEVFSSKNCEKLSELKRGEVVGVLRNNYMHIGIVSTPGSVQDHCMSTRIVSFTFIPDQTNRTNYNALELYRMAPFAKILETDLYDFLYFTKPTDEATFVRFHGIPALETTAAMAETYARTNGGADFGRYDLLTNNCETFVVHCLQQGNGSKKPGRQADRVLGRLIPWYSLLR